MDSQTPQINILTTRTKRLRPDDSDSETDTSIWPRFLIIESTCAEKPISKLSPFAISKGIQGLAGEPKSVRKLRSGHLLVEVDRESHARNLLRSTKLVDTPIKVSAHRTLNSKKGVIRCRDILDCSDEEILENLKSQHVQEVRRIVVTRDGTKKATGTFILTFGGTTLPKTVKVAYINVAVDPYIPSPMRCFKCQKFGHTKFNCRHTDTCARCGSNEHYDDRQCDRPARCVNCGGDHCAFDKTCAKWIMEKQIQTVRYSRNISFPEARKIVEGQRSQQSYSSVVASGAGTPAAAKQTVSLGTRAMMTQTDVSWLENMEQPKTTNGQSQKDKFLAVHAREINPSSTIKTTNSKSSQSTFRPTHLKLVDLSKNKTQNSSSAPVPLANRFSGLEDMDASQTPVSSTALAAGKGRDKNMSPLPRSVNLSESERGLRTPSLFTKSMVMMRML